MDEWLEILRQVLERLWPCLPFVHANFQVLVHDVDAPSAYAFGSKRSLIRAMAGDVLGVVTFQGQFQHLGFAAKVVTAFIRTTLSIPEKLMDISEAVGIHSVFISSAVVPTPVLMHVMSQSIL